MENTNEETRSTTTRKTIAKLLKTFVDPILAFEKLIFFSAGVKLPLLRSYFAWQSRTNQILLDMQATKKQAEYEKRIEEMMQKADQWRMLEKKRQASENIEKGKIIILPMINAKA